MKSNSAFSFLIKARDLSENAANIVLLDRFFIYDDCQRKIVMRPYSLTTQDIIYLSKNEKYF